MKRHIVSIIIPVRNAEKYIERCVQSAQTQTYTNLDIVLVLNDSSDHSEAICKKLESKDSRIRIIASAKGGVSHARNLGIEAAQGDYILFIDADDFIHENMVQGLYKEATKHKADLTVGSFEKYDARKLGGELDNLQSHSVSSTDFAQGMLLRRHGYDGYVWGKLYRAKTVSKVRFNETLKFSEDTDFLLKLLRQDIKVFISSFVGYFYSQDTSGITKDTSGSERVKSLTLAESFINEAVDSKIRSAAKCYYWRNTYYILSQNILLSKDEKTIWEAMKRYRLVVITSTLSPLKYRLIAAASLLGKTIFMKLTSKRVSRK